VTSRCIAHLDLDAFYVSVELGRRPELRGQPVVVAGAGPRAVVTTASYEARRFGIFSATPAARARRLCPQAVFLAPDFPAYRSRSGEVMAVLREEIAGVAPRDGRSAPQDAGSRTKRARLLDRRGSEQARGQSGLRRRKAGRLRAPVGR
jgi:DNA polymerase-4